jgi:hypothetical protein
MEQPQPTRYDVWASNLLLLSFGLMTVDAYCRGNQLFEPEMDWLNRGVWIAVYLFMGALYYQLRHGYRGVKTSFLLIIGVGIFNWLTDSGPRFSSGADYPLKHLMSWGQTGLTLAAALLVIVSLLLEYKAKPKP